MAKRSYKEHKADPFTRFPLLAWLLERKLLYIAMFAIVALGSTFWISRGLDSWSNIQAPVVKESPYAEVELINSPGKAWAESLIGEAPTDINQWEVAPSKRPAHPVPVSFCPAVGDISETVLNTHSASGEGVTAVIQVYGAGQAAVGFEKYLRALEICAGGERATFGELAAVRFNDGFLLHAGDSIVAVQAPAERIEALIQFYSLRAAETLTDSGCLALSYSAEDAQRSIFYNSEAYRGLIEAQTVETQVRTDGLPQPTALQVSQVAEPERLQPEAPLPEGFPTLPEELSEPELPVSPPTPNSFSGEVEYQVEDSDGPGCGWAWSAQSKPQVNVEELAKIERESIELEQAAVDEAAANFIDSKLSWALSVLQVAPTVDSYNRYVTEVNQTHGVWAALDFERELLREPWYAYVEAYNSWATFDARKAEAQTSYDQELKTCREQREELKKWEERYGDESSSSSSSSFSTSATTRPTPEPTTRPTTRPTPRPTPTPTPTRSTPPKPEGCETAPERPEILDIEKPAEPLAPVIPEGVTLPGSWPQPMAAPATAAVEEPEVSDDSPEVSP